MPHNRRYRFDIYPSWIEASSAASFVFTDGFFKNYYKYLQVIENGQTDNMSFFVVAVHDLEHRRFAGWLYGQTVPFKGSYLLPVFEQGAKVPWWVKMLDKYETRLFYMGNLFFPGDNGFYLEDDYATPGTRAAIINEVYPVLRKFLLTRCEGGVFSIADYAPKSLKASLLNKINGFSDFYTEPYMFLTMDPAWNTLNEYMSGMSSKYRVRIRKVLQESSAITIKPMDASELKDNEALIHSLYMDVANKASFNLGFVHAAYFHEILLACPDNFHVLGYWLDDKLVGFNSWFLGSHGDLHAHYIGLDYEEVTRHKLYNRMLISLVEAAIDQGATEIHFGRTAVEIKSTLGAEPANMIIHLRHTRGFANSLMRIPSRWSKPPEFEIRHPFQRSTEGVGNQ